MTARALLLPVLFAAGACVAPSAPVATALQDLVVTPELAGARVGVCVVDGADGEVLVAHDADLGFATASNMKLVAAALGLSTLGPDHRMPTELWARGPIVDGVLHGDLVLRGHGDPTFAAGANERSAWTTLTKAVVALGVRQVRGRCIADDTWLGREHLGIGWQWDYLDEDYAAPFGGLCVGGNVVRVTVRPGAGGPTAQCTPAVLPPPRVEVQQLPPGGGTRLSASRALGSETIVVRGAIASDAWPQSVAVPVPDPTAFAARVLRAELVAAGVDCAGSDTDGGEASGEERLVAAVASPTVGALLPRLLGNSDNLYAEQVARVAARVATGDGGTASLARHAAGVLRGFGIDTSGMVVADGSGLSRRNLVQPRQLVGVLAAMWRSPHRDAFVAALPVAGKTGTLRNRFGSGPAHGRVQAKTGFIARVVCLSGYVPRPDPALPPLLFSVMLNDFTCSDDEAKAAADAFVQRLAAHAGW
jgi:D-alanyl-D-alanine carboxypeptidase/D-alanyl-D-alanine-endopeptidase (penicillin-binding protein 4)